MPVTIVTGPQSSGSGSGVQFDGTVSVGDIMKCSSISPDTIGEVTAIPESLIVSNHAVATFTALVSGSATVLSGTSISSIVFAWTYNRNGNNPTSQSIGISSSSNFTGAPTPGAQAVGLRTVTSSGLTAGITTAPSPGTVTFSLTGTGDDGTALSATATLACRNRRYYGVSTSVLSTDAAIVAALSNEFAVARADSETFDASAGGGLNYLYYAYPSYLGSPASTTFNGFAFTDYTESTITAFDNGTGFTEDYILLRTNNVYSGSGIVWAIT